MQYDAPYVYWRPYFEVNCLLLTLVSYMDVLLTLGVVFPPVAVVMLMAIATTAYAARIHVGRFLTDSLADRVHKHVDIIDAECQRMGNVLKLRRCMRFLAITAVLFYLLYLFGILGDTRGADHAYWVFVVMPLVPLLIFAALDQL